LYPLPHLRARSMFFSLSWSLKKRRRRGASTGQKDCGERSLPASSPRKEKLVYMRGKTRRARGNSRKEKRGSRTDGNTLRGSTEKGRTAFLYSLSRRVRRFPALFGGSAMEPRGEGKTWRLHRRSKQLREQEFSLGGKSVPRPVGKTAARD